jgi:two-component system, NarL family, response regulator NreC
MTPYHITLADDHTLLRQGLKRIIEESGEMRVVGEAGDGLELINLLNKTVPDMVVLDISMPNLRGIEAIGEIKSRFPRVKTLILTMHRDAEYLYQAFTSGADGYLLKEDADSDLFTAIDKIRQGGFYVSPSLTQELVACWRRAGKGEDKSSFAGDCLTTREREVIKLIAEGRSSVEIARLLCISVRTVDQHRINIRNKLRLRKTADLVKYAVSKGYIQVLPYT